MTQEITLGELYLQKGSSVNPLKFEDETFELYSIPAYDRGVPEVLKGKEIGSSKKELRPGDVVLSRIVPHIRRCWIIPNNNEYRKIGSGEWIVFRSKKIDNNFLRFFLLSDVFNQMFLRTIKGVGGSLMRADPKQVAKFKIPLPPLETQKKIAAILDEADKLRQLDQQLIEKYDALTQSLFLDMFGDPVTNPKGWKSIKLVKVTSKIGSGATPRGGKESYRDEGISLIRSLNIYDNKFKYENLAHISDDQAEKLKNVIVEENDVLFNITGASICRSTIVPKDVLPARVNQHVSILRPLIDKLSPLFLNHFLISENVKNQLLGVGSGGGAVMQAITKKQLTDLEIIIPPISLQNQFAKRVEAIEAQKALAQQSLEKSEELFNSLLQKAFKGELV